MFSKKSKELVKKLVQSEYVNAVETYGNEYESDIVMCEVLNEEMNEAHEEVKATSQAFVQFLENLKDNKDCQKELNEVEERATLAIRELAQVCAVVQKCRNTMGY